MLTSIDLSLFYEAPKEQIEEQLLDAVFSTPELPLQAEISSYRRLSPHFPKALSAEWLQGKFELKEEQLDDFFAYISFDKDGFVDILPSLKGEDSG